MLGYSDIPHVCDVGSDRHVCLSLCTCVCAPEHGAWTRRHDAIQGSHGAVQGGWPGPIRPMGQLATLAPDAQQLSWPQISDLLTFLTCLTGVQNHQDRAERFNWGLSLGYEEGHLARSHRPCTGPGSDPELLPSPSWILRNTNSTGKGVRGH